MIVTSGTLLPKLDRRSLLKAAAAAGIAQLAAPFVITARAADEIKFGLDDPLTGTYAELGKNEQIGCQLAIDQINAKGGILGRQAQLLVEDSTSADTGTAVQKGRKLIERDKVDFLLGNVNSAMAIALGQVSNELKKLHIVTGGHTDAVTGTNCHWNVFRVCNTTRMETNSVSKTLFSKYGKKWYFLTPDYAFGHTLQQGFEASLKKFGGTEVGASLTPLGSHRLFLLSDQGAGGEPRRHHLSAGGQRCRQRAQAGGPVRPRQAFSYRRRAAGARSFGRPAARGAHRHLGVRVVLGPAERAARRGVCRRGQKG